MALYTRGYSGPQEVRYLFIDGQQLQSTRSEVGREWFGSEIELDYRLLQGTHTKVFYYDCLPAKRPDEDEEQFEALRKQKERFFDQLRELPGWHVSEGLARHRKKRGLEQKEVDILIAVDMLTHTHRRNMHRLTFISGDQDFAPLVEAVVREGMYVELLYPEGHTSRDLKAFADAARPMNLDCLYGWASEDFRRRYPLPTRSYEFDGHPNDGVLLEHGYRNGETVARLWRRGDSGAVTAVGSTRTTGGHCLWVTHPSGDIALIKRIFSIAEGPVEWRVHG